MLLIQKSDTSRGAGRSSAHPQCCLEQQATTQAMRGPSRLDLPKDHSPLQPHRTSCQERLSHLDSSGQRAL